MCFKYYIDVLGTDDEYYEIPLHVEYYATHQPAEVSKAPEDCYPADSNMEIEEVSYYLKDTPITDEQVRAAITEAEDAIIDAAWEDYFTKFES